MTRRFLWVLLFFCAFCACMVPIRAAFAQRPVESFRIGEDLKHQLSVCLSRESALAVADADMTEGFEAAKKIFEEKPDCDVVPVYGASVGRVVRSAKVIRGDEKKTLSVVEILNEGKVVAFFITSTPILARLSVVPSAGSNT